MRIFSIELENFRMFEKKRVEFPAMFSVLIGENASGKTTILDAVSQWVWTHLLAGFVEGEGGNVWTVPELSDFRYTVDRFEDRNRAGYLHITLSYLLEGYDPVENHLLECYIQYPRESGQATISYRAPSQPSNWQFKADVKKMLFEGKNPILPVFEFFPARSSSLKRVELPPGFTKNGSNRIQKGYIGAMEKSNEKVQHFVNWYKTTWADAQNHPIDKYPEKAYLHDQLACIQSSLALAIPQWKDPHFVFGDNDILGRLVPSEDKIDQGELIYFRDLSDGYQRMIGLVGTIAWRCASLNPHFGREAHLHSPGIVLIDELDLHLHPKWQRRIVSDLKRTFPKIQFICTTHSPFIVQSLSAEEVIDLDGLIEYNPKELALEDVAKLMGVESPFSIQNEEDSALAEQYLKVVRGVGKKEVVYRGSSEVDNERLDELEAKMANPAMRALLKLERLKYRK